MLSITQRARPQGREKHAALIGRALAPKSAEEKIKMQKKKITVLFVVTVALIAAAAAGAEDSSYIPAPDIQVAQSPASAGACVDTAVPVPAAGHREGDVLPDGRYVGTPPGERNATLGDVAQAAALLSGDAAINAEGDMVAPTPVVVKTRVSRTTRVVRESMSTARFTEFFKSLGGAASDWSRTTVQAALNRGQERGGLNGCSENATVDDPKWQSPATREMLAVVAVRCSQYAERLLGAHNTDPEAHQDIRQDVAGASSRANWGIGLAILALLVGIGRYFYPRIRMPRPRGYYGNP